MQHVARTDHYRWGNATFNWVNKRKAKAAWHRRLIGQTLDRVLSGEIKRLVINIPYRHWKTEEAVVNLISRIYAVNPAAMCWHATHSMDLVRTNSRKIKAIVESPQFMSSFDARISIDSSAQNHWETIQRGLFHGSTLAGFGITGFGAGINGDPFDGVMVIDDPQDARKATSRAHRSEAQAGSHNLITTRLNHKDTPVIYIQQRLDSDDGSSFLLNGGTGDVWDTLCLPGVNETGRPPENYRKYSHCRLIDYEMEPGALYPKKMNVSDWNNVRDAKAAGSDEQPVGLLAFASQVQQNPTDSSVALYRKEWVKDYTEDQLPITMNRMRMRIDTAQKGGFNSDYHGMIVEGACPRHDQSLWVLDCDQRKCEFPDLLKWVIDHAKRLKEMETRTLSFSDIVIEDANIGAALKSTLEGEFDRLDIKVGVSLTPKYGSKFDRAMECVPFYQQGRIYMPIERTTFMGIDGEEMIGELRDQHKSFTQADTHANDDMLDPLNWALVTEFGNAPNNGGWAYGNLRG